MAHTDRWISRSADTARDDANRKTQTLAGMALALVLVIASLFVIRHMHASSAIEDCMMAARQNCDVMVSLNH